MDPAWSWADIVGLAMAAASTVIALVAVAVAIRSDRRTREVVKVQTYLALRTGFLSIYKDLGRLEEAAADDVELLLARQAYWHHAWDEWYVSNALAPREFQDLWSRFFAVAVRSGLAHPALRSTLDEMARDEESGFGTYAQRFIAEIRTGAGAHSQGAQSATDEHSGTEHR